MAEQKTTNNDPLIGKTTKALRSLGPIFAFVRPYKLVAAAAMMILVVTALAKLSMGQGFHFIINNGFVNGTEALLMQANLLFIVLITLLAAGTAMRFYLMTWLGERVSADIRKAVFKRIIHLHPGYFEENRSGEIMSRLTADTSVLQSIIGTSFAVSLGNILMLIGSVVMLLVINFKLTLLVIAFVPVILIPMSFFGRKVRQLASSSQGAVADISTFAGEIIQNIKVVQGYTRESQEQQAFDHEAERAFELAKHRVKHRALMIGAVSFLTFSAIDLMFWVGGMDVQAGRMSGGELGAFVFYAVMVAFSMAGVAEIYGELQRAAGASKRLIELLQTESQIRNPASPLPFFNVDEISNDTVIEFKQVDFHYPSRPDSPALTDINLLIPKNKVTAIVGPSGAGKTTLF